MGSSLQIASFIVTALCDKTGCEFRRKLDTLSPVEESSSTSHRAGCRKLGNMLSNTPLNRRLQFRCNLPGPPQLGVLLPYAVLGHRLNHYHSGGIMSATATQLCV